MLNRREVVMKAQGEEGEARWALANRHALKC